MVRFSFSTAKQILPLKTPVSDSNFVSKKQQFLILLKICSSFKQILQIHAQIQISGLQRDTFLLSELIRVSSLSATKSLSYARSLLDNSADTTPSTWNMLIRGYSSSDSPEEAIWVFREMKRRGIKPNKLTFPFFLKACSSCFGLTGGRQVQVEVLKLGLDSDVYIGNNLVHLYGSCNKISCARKVFDEMPERSVVSWNAMITACIANSKLDLAIGYFVEMIISGFEPDETTMVVMVSVCTELGNLSLGKLIHSQVIVRWLELNCKLGTALIDMYAKCGGIDYARVVFNLMKEKNVWTWSAMVLGLAQNGFAKEALEVFSTMKKSSVKPNYVTFLGVLCACSHTGMVEDGYKYFHEMEHKNKIKPMMIHYGAMVDLLSRAGRLKEAYRFIKRMPFDPDPIVLRTLLGACSIHPDKDDEGIGEEVQKRLLELEPKRSGNFVIVANKYAEAGKWDKAADVRKVMKDGKMKKIAGESCLELGGSVYRFFSGYDDSRPDFLRIYQLLDWLRLHLKSIDV